MKYLPSNYISELNNSDVWRKLRPTHKSLYQQLINKCCNDVEKERDKYQQYWLYYFPRIKITHEQSIMLTEIGGLSRWWDVCRGTAFLSEDWSDTITWLELAVQRPYFIPEYMEVIKRTYLG